MATPKLDIDKVLKNFPLEKPRDIQVQAMKDVVTAFNEGAEYVALEVPVGGGKSGIAVALARTMGQSYMLTLTEQLQQQYLRDFKHLGMEVLLGRGKFPCHTLGGDATCADGRIMKADCEPDACAYKRAKNKALTAPHVVANYHSYAYNLGMTGGGGRKQDDDGPSPVRDLTVVDECFPAGTLVAPGQRIEDVKVGDIVPSFDEATGRVVAGEVVRLYRKKPSGLVSVRLANGVTIVCTPDHPFWTPDGWKPARDIGLHYVLHTNHGTETNSPSFDGPHLRDVREAMDVDSSRASSSAEERASVQPALLLSSVRGEGAGRVGDVRSEPQDALEAHVSCEPDARCCNASESSGITSAGRELEASSARWERNESNGSAEALGDSPGLADGGRRGDGPEEGSRGTDCAEGGHRVAGSDGGNRGGRQVPLREASGAGRAQGPHLALTRVDRVEVLEPGSDGTYGGLCPGGEVFNFEVKGTHTYFANGAVVHNCHAMEPFLLDAVGLTVRLEKVPVVGLPPPPDEQERFEPYRVYLREELVPRLKDYLDKARKRQVLDPKTEDELSTLLGRMQGILLNDEDEWVPERGTNERGDVIRSWFALKPLRVSRYGKWLTGYGKRVLLMSGTILSPFHLVTSIGLDPEKGQTFTYDSPFPVENRPVYVGNLDMSYKARDASWPVMVQMVKELLEAHANEKGLLLCSSNVMLDHIIKSLPPQLSRRILKATGEQRMAKYNEHLASRMPTVLGASGFWEGADLKGDASRFQIIPAVPRPIWQGQVKARAEREAGWYDWLSYTKLMQGFGRSVRSETDTAVTYLLDKAFRREFKKANGLIPLWLKSSIHLID